MKLCYLTLIFLSNIPNLHGMQNLLALQILINELEEDISDRQNSYDAIYEIYNQYQALSPAERALHWLRDRQTEAEIAHDIASLPELKAEIAQLEIELARARERLYRCAQGA